MAQPDRPPHGDHGVVSRETRERLDLFAALLLRWTGRINLIAAADAAEIWPRHIEDSLQLSPLIAPSVRRAADLGSGAGFPGLVLAIATGVHFDLIEADHRKASFLREAVRVTSAPATVHVQRIEALTLAPVELVTARALAPLPKLLSLTSRFLESEGQALFLKGETAEQELTAAAKDWHMQVHRTASRTHPRAIILQITGLHRVQTNV